MPLCLMIDEEFSIKCDQAHNGLVAVQKFKNDFFKDCGCGIHYKLILMDLQMPNMNGFDATLEILKVMKDYGKEDQCRIVALSSYTNIECINRCLNMGMVEFANKPIHFNQLKTIVQNHHFRGEEVVKNKCRSAKKFLHSDQMLGKFP